jgi:inositol hexakisphosphate/diphosphoinositol-pentakisphosphate kinase
VCEADLHVIGNPVQCCVKVYKLVCKLVEIVRSKRDDPKTKSMSSCIFFL